MIKCFSTTALLVKELSRTFYEFLRDATDTYNGTVNLAFSGGNTPRLFFQQLAGDLEEFRDQIRWQQVHFFWVDERCIPADHKESNYGMFRDTFLNKVKLSSLHIHPIIGDHEPEYEAIRYASVINQTVPVVCEIPVFDWVFLGVGEDGHTASIFPGFDELFCTSDICAAVKHPQTGQIRITLTGKILAHAKKITFVVTGTSKKKVVHSILNQLPEAENYPAFKITKLNNCIDWYLDQEAAT